jgi:hypothetical protein
MHVNHRGLYVKAEAMPSECVSKIGALIECDKSGAFGLRIVFSATFNDLSGVNLSRIFTGDGADCLS